MDSKSTKIAVTYLTDNLPDLTEGLYAKLTHRSANNEEDKNRLTTHLLTETLTFLSKNL